MSIYKLIPPCKDYLWGGRRLVDEYGIKYDGKVCAEAWMLSCHKDGECVVDSGRFAGKGLSEVIKAKGKEVLGTNCSKYSDFPIMIKLIDAREKLSLQVHPDDAYALNNEGQYGKTEVWYILDADEGACLYKGFEKDITSEEFIERVINGTLSDVIHKIYVKKGDVVFVPPGTLHAIGEGILLAEIQQSSDITYRISDYGRLGADNKPRPLQIIKALEVLDFHKDAKAPNFDGHLCSCDYFTVDAYKVSSVKSYFGEANDSSFVSLIVTEGDGEVSNSKESFKVTKGDSLFISAGSGNFTVNGNLDLICTRVRSNS